MNLHKRHFSHWQIHFKCLKNFMSHLPNQTDSPIQAGKTILIFSFLSVYTSQRCTYLRAFTDKIPSSRPAPQPRATRQTPTPRHSTVPAEFVGAITEQNRISQGQSQQKPVFSLSPARASPGVRPSLGPVV